jgi:hypothetical protein
VRKVHSALLAFAIVTVAAAQSTEPPISDTRLTVHTLVREDIFAGWLDNNMDRFARAERNIETLLTARPSERADLMAWRGGATMYRAVVAHEAGNAAEFTGHYQRASADFAEAAKLSAGNDGVAAITGGTLVVFADRLPAEQRAAAWAQAYEAYSMLYKQQGAALEKFPVHFKGEVLAGMAQSAQRTGRGEEATRYVDKMLTMTAGTPYEKLAKDWKANPEAAAKTNLTCKTCHGPGRLSARLADLNK